MSYFIIVPIILMSIIIHEVSHGYAALLLGDDTAKRYKRLNFNPINHIDLFGTVILPILLLITTRGGLVFGYAKPVPINPYNFKDMKRDTGLTAAAGPASNFLIAIVFSLVLRVIIFLEVSALPVSVLQAIYMIIFFNLILACFNLIPFPPLDGSKIIGMFLPDRIYAAYVGWERKGMAIFMGIILISYVFRLNIIGTVIFPPVSFLMGLLTGIRF